MGDNFGDENLEDGELWLPSDFFAMDEIQLPSKNSTPLGIWSSSKPTCMEGFQRFPHNSGFCKPLPTLQRFDPSVWHGYTGYSGDSARQPCNCGPHRSWTGCSPVYQLQRLNPVQDQIEAYMAERARAEQRLQHNGVVLNRVLPQAGTGARGGTGVFLPRVCSYTGTKKVVNPSDKVKLHPRKMAGNRREEEWRGSCP